MKGPNSSLYENTELNIIPLIDVLLVLVCILFLMIPSVGSKLPLQINLPQSASLSPLDSKFITIEVKSDGRVSRRDLNTFVDLSPQGLAFVKDQNVLLAADSGSSWNNIARVLGRLTKAGAKVSIAVSPEPQLQ